MKYRHLHAAKKSYEKFMNDNRQKEGNISGRDDMNLFFEMISGVKCFLVL